MIEGGPREQFQPEAEPKKAEQKEEQPDVVLPEQKPESLKIFEGIQEKSTAELAGEVIESVKKITADLIEKGIVAVEKIGETAGLKLEELVQAAEGSSFFSRLKNLQDRARAFAERFGEDISDISGEKEKPVIIPGSTFDPYKELGEIHKLPKAEQRPQLENYKEKLAFQKEGLAVIQEKLTAAIRANPDTPVAELYQTVRIDIELKYGLTDWQKDDVKHFLQIYGRKHDAVKKTRQNYPNDADLFKAVFGKAPEWDIQVIEGPMTLYFRCRDIKDYALIYSQSFVSNRSVKEEDINAANMSGGVMIYESLIPELKGLLIAEKALGIRWFSNNRDTLNHEEQHAINNLFIERAAERDLFGRIKNAGSDEEKKLALRAYLRHWRENADSRTRDEILAYFKEGAWSLKEVFENLTRPSEKGGIYDYLNTQEKNRMSAFFDRFLGEEIQPLASHAIEDIYVKEYRRVLQDGLDVVSDLTRAGYSKDKVIALLLQEPLPKWKKICGRLLESKKPKL